MKLFKFRLATVYANSPSQVGSSPDVYVIATSLEEAKKKAYNISIPNRWVINITMEEEIPVIY